MGRKVSNAVEDLPRWQLVFTLTLLPILCIFALMVVYPDLQAIFNGNQIVSYNFRKVYVLTSPLFLVPVEILLGWKFIFKKSTDSSYYKFIEKFILYVGIIVLISAPFSNLALKYYMGEKGYIYCEEQSDAIWNQVYVLDDQLCTQR